MAFFLLSRTAALSACLLCSLASHSFPDVKNVHYVVLHHFDVGWDDTISNVLAMYLNESGTFAWRNHYAPGEVSKQPNGLIDRAMDVIDTLHKSKGEERLVFSTWAYILKLYLDGPCGFQGFPCPSAERRLRLANAIKRGDISYHANPLNSEGEMWDEATLAAGIDAAHDLDKRFGRSPRTAIAQEDDPGETRGIVPVMASRGVLGMYVGYNDASMPLKPFKGAPESLAADGRSYHGLPYARLFAWRWRDTASGKEVFSLFHTGGHGATDVSDGIKFDTLATNTLVIPRFDHAIAIRGSDDKPPGLGPSQIWCDNDSDVPCAGHGNVTDVIVKDWKQLHDWFPNAKVFASTLDSYFEALNRSDSAKAALPVFTGEVGDTWIYGVSSDPYKVSALRAIGRARANYLASTPSPLLDERYKNFSWLFLKSAEETWGEKGLCEPPKPSDGSDWCSNAVFNASAACHPLQSASWMEQRAWSLEKPVEALGSHPLASIIGSELAQLRTSSPPDLTGLAPVPGSAWSDVRCGMHSPRVGFNHLGAMTVLGSLQGDLLSFGYQTFSSEELTKVADAYYPGDGPEYFTSTCGNTSKSAITFPRLRAMWSTAENHTGVCRIVLQIDLPSNVTVDYGAPAQLWADIFVEGSTKGDASLNASLILLNKTTTRQKESAFVSFAPSAQVAEPKTMEFHKVSTWVSPLEVAMFGSRHIHYVSDKGVRWGGSVGEASGQGELTVRSLDAGLLAVGDPRPVPVPGDALPNVSQGVAFNLWNNLWNTNYIFWYPYGVPGDENLKFRFGMSWHPKQPSSLIV